MSVFFAGPLLPTNPATFFHASCRQHSGSSACRRIQAARCIREHPEMLALLEAGELDLGTVYLIERVLTEENRAEILARVRGRSYRERAGVRKREKSVTAQMA